MNLWSHHSYKHNSSNISRFDKIIRHKALLASVIHFRLTKKFTITKKDYIIRKRVVTVEEFLLDMWNSIDFYLKGTIHKHFLIFCNTFWLRSVKHWVFSIFFVNFQGLKSTCSSWKIFSYLNIKLEEQLLLVGFFHSEKNKVLWKWTQSLMAINERYQKIFGFLKSIEFHFPHHGIPELSTR